MPPQAEKALSEDRFLHSLSSFGAVDHRTFADDPERFPLCDRFFELFHQAMGTHDILRIVVPWRGTFLSELELNPVGSHRGTILFRCGYDSFIEEFCWLLRHFARAGFGVVGFCRAREGGTRRKAGFPMAYPWERPGAEVSSGPAGRFCWPAVSPVSLCVRWVEASKEGE